MRYAHRMKEKYDLSLDNRQIVSLVIGGLVVLGAVFVLGVVVGKKLAGSEKTAQAPDLLTALDQKAEVPLTFQDELTKKSAPIVPPPPAPAPVAAAPKPAPAEAQKPEQQKPVIAEASKPTPAEAQKPEPAKAEVAEAAAKPSGEEHGTPDHSTQHAEAPAKPQVAAAEPNGKVEDAETPTRTASRDGGLKDAFARATTPSAPAKPPAEAKAGGAWTLQLSASQSKDEADKFAARLRDRGYAPFIVKADVPGRGTWYRVRMGSFPTKDAASRYLNDFKRETSIEAFVANAN